MIRSVIAVDWSGDRINARRHIWLAEADAPGRLLRLECGRNQDEITEQLLKLVEGSPPSPWDPSGEITVVGLDFAFAFPLWFTETLGIRSGPELWAHASIHGGTWLETCAPPFWGRPGKPRPPLVRSPYRRTELAAPRIPKSVFQIGGAGSVGTGSVRGMALLHQLACAGATIWPFAVGGSPLLVEIYPRLLTGPVRKSRASERAELLDRRYPDIDAAHRDLAVASEDAFDAAVSALVMAEHHADLATLPLETDPILQLEGRIWHPAWRQDRL